MERVGRLHKLATVALGVFPVLVCAWLASRSGRWDVFERSGSIATTIGLILASGYSIRHSVFDLAATPSVNRERSFPEAFDEIIGARIAFVLSGFGKLVWGWGIYLRRWSFLYLAFWGLLAAYKVDQDHNRLGQ